MWIQTNTLRQNKTTQTPEADGDLSPYSHYLVLNTVDKYDVHTRNLSILDLKSIGNPYRWKNRQLINLRKANSIEIENIVSIVNVADTEIDIQFGACTD